MTLKGMLDTQETMPVIVKRMAATSPHRNFVHVVGGEGTTWLQLQSRIDEWTARFIALGVEPNDVVVTFVDAGLEALASWLALASLGAIDAATNTEYRGRMLAYAVNNCKPTLVVASRASLPALEAVSDELLSVTQVLIVDGVDSDKHDLKLPNVTLINDLSVDLAAARSRQLPPKWSDIACVTYTSGTTGPSKAVMLPWAQLNSINLGTFPFDDLSPSDTFYCTTSHAHFGSKSIPYLAAMVEGQVVIRPRFSLSSFWQDIADFNVTTAMLVGSMADMLIRSADSPSSTSLKNLFMAPLGSSHRHFSERYGTRICTVYNSTEGGVAISSGWNPTDERTVGRLREGYPGFEVRLVDEHDVDVRDGTPGECIIRSAEPWVMNAGYLNNPEATVLAWRNGWFHTGDVLVKGEDGGYMFVDRLKDVIRRRGENISSHEVESDVLLNPDVLECAAVAVQADTCEDEILLFVVVRTASALTPADLLKELEVRMPKFMVPRYVEFIDALPKTQATQRIIKADLRKRGVGPSTWDRQLSRYVHEVRNSERGIV